MPWPRPLRSALAAGEGFLDRVLCVAGAVAFSQAPEFMQQYLQRLGGHLDEARRQLEQFRTAAAASGLTVAQLAATAGRDADAAVARLGGIVAGAVTRVDRLAADEQAIRGASVLTRPVVFLHHADPEIARATWRAFRPAFPTTLEGAYYAVLGMIFLLLVYHGAVKRPVRHLWRRHRRRLATAPMAALILAGFFLSSARGQPAALSETEIKALFVFHFTQFVDWPSAAFGGEGAPLRIGVAGDDRLESVLARLVRGEKMNSHALEVEIVKTPAEAAQCQILYLAPGTEDLAGASAVREHPVLTVGASDAFARDGGMIRFVPERTHMRLRINVRAAKAASLEISSKLLRIADVIGGGDR